MGGGGAGGGGGGGRGGAGEGPGGGRGGRGGGGAGGGGRGGGRGGGGAWGYLISECGGIYRVEGFLLKYCRIWGRHYLCLPLPIIHVVKEGFRV